MSLNTFIEENREELVWRARGKVAKRSISQPSAEAEREHGVPVLLSQLVEALDAQARIDAASHDDAAEPDPGCEKATEDIERSARAHGQDLKKFGFTIGQVVHCYGDICQSVTELALERKAALTTSEFHTLNGCLDNAIAEAVTSWNHEPAKSDTSSESFASRLEPVLDAANLSYEALRQGRVGMGGATSGVLDSCLVKIRSILDDMKK